MAMTSFGFMEAEPLAAVPPLPSANRRLSNGSWRVEPQSTATPAAVASTAMTTATTATTAMTSNDSNNNSCYFQQQPTPLQTLPFSAAVASTAPTTIASTAPRATTPRHIHQTVTEPIAKWNLCRSASTTTTVSIRFLLN
eukprot:TRINITY_DN17924_c0_g1_i2.p1 TRINITY_DN17924_c0_g1~~TRINITY_DN17924_c0_g1_i2.p1  ORF type:complete len:140 (+),score=32.94 TRINITY_DN17924_c0_g1_i2:34-453(+)